MEISVGVPQKAKTRTMYDPDTPLLSVDPKERNLRKTETPATHVYSSASHNGQALSQSRCPRTTEWIKNAMEYYSAIKKNKICQLQENGWNWSSLW
jgi:hypothetical protein